MGGGGGVRGVGLGDLASDRAESMARLRFEQLRGISTVKSADSMKGALVA